MTTNLRWIASVSATALHAADCVSRGLELVDPRLRAAVEEPARAIQAELASRQLPVERIWRQLLTHCHHVENNRELAALALRKSLGAVPHLAETAERLGMLIGALEGSVMRAIPGIVDELAHRSRPIRELWEARGPGLLRQIGLRTDETLVVDSAELVLVLPALGGGGVAQLANNSVRWEAVLTNPVPSLPEVVRLAWLIAQLHCDLPKYGERIPADHLPEVAQLALIPPTLEGAEELELVAPDPALWSTAWRAWRVGDDPSQPETVRVWWETYRETRPNWGTALTALEQMLRGGAASE